MASKKKHTETTYDKAPQNLNEHPFYGIKLDEEQLEYANSIWDQNVDIVFCNAAAGTGKTLVSLGVANLLVKHGLFDNIVWLINPTQEGKVGYRPGTTEEKLAPYFGPLYDAAVTLGINPYQDIVVANDSLGTKTDAYITCTSPIFLRGRNIPASQSERTVLICDESQNMYLDELQTVLTRVNVGAKVVVIGHSGQCDLYHNPERSGFVPFIELFKDQPRCRVCNLTQNHRHWISRHADTIKEFLKTKVAE